jgi:RNA polymerase sigma-70 factor (ECF subfamily)
VRGLTTAAASAASATRFDALYRANVRALLGFALRRVGQPSDAADVVADTMLVAWRRLDDVPPGDEARLWLYGVARRVLANRRRGDRRRDRLGSRLRDDVGRLVASDHAVAVATGVDVRAALGALGADDRELLQLTAWEGLAPHEVATVLGISDVAVRSRLHRARARLRQELGPQRPAGGGHGDGDEHPLVRSTEDDR